MREIPSGCLKCNHDEVVAFLMDVENYTEGDIERFVEVPRPRHKWSDIIVCLDCGVTHLVMPRKDTNDESHTRKTKANKETGQAQERAENGPSA